MRDNHVKQELHIFLDALNNQYLVYYLRNGQNFTFGGVAFKFVAETINHWYYIVVKSFIR